MPPAEERHSPLLRCDILKVFRRQPGLSEVAGAGGTKGTSRHETFTQIKVSGHRRTRLTRLIRNLSPGRKGGEKKRSGSARPPSRKFVRELTSVRRHRGRVLFKYYYGMSYFQSTLGTKFFKEAHVC